MAVKEGKWRCPACEAVNLGREMKCSSCGTTRGEHVEFFLDDDAQEVQDQNLMNRAQGGADWHCDFCGTDNRADESVCSQCGAPATGMQRRQQQMRNADGSAQQAAPPPQPAPQTKKNPLAIILIALGVVAAIGLVIFLSRGKEDYLRLEGGEWTRTIAIERQEWIEYEAWYDQVPNDGRIIRTWEEQRDTERVQIGTEQVKTGTKDLGNGFFEDVYEERPVYEERAIMDTRVEYELREWTKYRSVESSGEYDIPPAWPDPALRGGDREGQRSESAVLFFSSTDPEKEGETFRYDSLTPAEIKNFQMGVDYKAMVSGSNVRRFIEEEE